MSRYSFSDAQRWAIFRTHGTNKGTKCWLCHRDLDFLGMEVDHVIPERLLEPECAEELAKALHDFGLPATFDLNSYENWLPSHRACNADKRGTVFRPTPIIQLWLDRARSKAAKAAKREGRKLSEKKEEQALGELLSADRATKLRAASLLAADYAEANTSQVEVVSFGTGRPDTIGFAMPTIHIRYQPPERVRLSPEITVVYDAAPKANSGGPFIFEIRNATGDETEDDA